MLAGLPPGRTLPFLRSEHAPGLHRFPILSSLAQSPHPYTPHTPPFNSHSQFDLVGIPPSPRGVPQIEVTFDIDANGIVHVAAKDKSTGKEQSITIQSSGGLSESQIQSMVSDAERFASEDAERKAQIDARNDADAALYSADKSLAEYKDRLPQAVVDEIEAAAADLRGALESASSADLKEKVTALQTASMKIGSSLSGQAGAAGAENVQDAEVKDKKE